jgi:hypothetical protein
MPAIPPPIFAQAIADMHAALVPMLANVVAVIDGQSVPAMFANAYASAAFDQIALDASRPTLTVLTANTPANPAGTDVTVNAVDYIVRSAEPDGLGPTGLTRLVLEQLYATEPA